MVVKRVFLGLVCLVVNSLVGSWSYAGTSALGVSDGGVIRLAKQMSALSNQQSQTPLDLRLPNNHNNSLIKWFDAVGPRRDTDSFGELVLRAALVQLSKPYKRQDKRNDEQENSAIDINTFQCVSLLEGALALARCTWMDQRNRDCFIAEVERSRYQGGVRKDYASRLHYFTDWLYDNVERDRMQFLSSEMGGRAVSTEFWYMTENPNRYPPLANVETRAQIKQVERRLSGHRPIVVDRDNLFAAQRQLRAGDIVAIVGSKPGLLVTHVGIVHYGGDSRPQLLHASSYHKRILVTTGDIYNYVIRRPERRGIMAARPLPPVLFGTPQ